MVASDTEIEQLASRLIARHGPLAARVATERLNEMIDRDNTRARDVWACVVHRIHARLGTGPDWPHFPIDYREEAPHREPALH